MKKQLLIFMILIMSVVCVSAENSGYTQYSASNVDYNLTLNLADTIYVSDIDIDVSVNSFGLEVDGWIFEHAKEVDFSTYDGLNFNGLHFIRVEYDEDMQISFNDIRFCNADSSILGYQFIDTFSDDAVFCINVTDYTKPVYIVYGNSTATTNFDTSFTPPEYFDEEFYDLNYFYSTSTTYELVKTFTIGGNDNYFGDIYVDYISFDIGSTGTPLGVGYKVTGTTGGNTYTLKEGVYYGSGTSEISYYERFYNQDYDDNIEIKFYIKKLDSATTNAYIFFPYITASRGFADTILTTDQELNLLDEYSIEATAGTSSDSTILGYDESDTLYLSPNDNISSITFISDSYSWNYDAIIYWTEDTAIYDEYYYAGNAFMEVTYTPSEYIDVGYINATYSITNFTETPPLGDMTVTLDGSDYSAYATRDGQSVSLYVEDLDTTEHTITFNIPVNVPPELVTPTDTYEYNVDFPPLLHDITLTWEDAGYESYTYVVAKDEYFNRVVVDYTDTESTSVDLSLEGDTYYWKVRGYNPVLDEYTSYSDVYSFSFNESTADYGTSIQGVVYDVSSGEQQTVLSGAVVKIYNDTWSDTYLTSSNGYFIFTGLTNSTYYLIGTKDGYDDSTINVVTPSLGLSSIHNILMEAEYAPNYITPHYVQFVVKSLTQHYSGVTIKIYQGDSSTPLTTMTTDSTGTVSYKLSETVKYRITAYKEGIIDREVTIYPDFDKFTFWVDLEEMFTSLFTREENEVADNIAISVTTDEIDFQNVDIDVSYLDSLSETNSVDIVLYHQIYAIDGDNLEQVDTITYNDDSDIEHTFSITSTEYAGETYVVVVTFDHDTHGEVTKNYAITFPPDTSVYGIGIETFIWMIVLLIIWFGSSATEINVVQTAFGMVGLVSILKAIDFTGDYVSWYAIILAWVIVIAAYFIETEKKG